MLDVCYACGPVPRAVALPMFLSAKDGHHTKLPPVRMRRCRHAELTFEEPDYPIQADGEPVDASRIEVDVLGSASKFGTLPASKASGTNDYSSLPGLRRLAFLMALKCLSLSLR